MGLSSPSSSLILVNPLRFFLHICMIFLFHFVTIKISKSTIDWYFFQWLRRWILSRSTPTRGLPPVVTPNTMVSAIYFKVCVFLKKICKYISCFLLPLSLIHLTLRWYARQPWSDGDWSDPPAAHVLVPLPPGQTHPASAQGAQSTPGNLIQFRTTNKQTKNKV